ncbi:GNAT family N-acetyltransferase [Paenibacillus sp. SAF-054]|uniref:GNAT family N-acetyltransferase n=1 Tax=unclassified Paenibacillus TaxID=185978 RepID=UPI003F7D6536
MKGKNPLADVRQLDLGASLRLRRADPVEWRRYFSIYYNQAAVGFDRQADSYSLLPDEYMTYWLEAEDSLIGGVALAHGAIRHLFGIPPWGPDGEWLRMLVRKLRQLDLNGEGPAFNAYDILDDQEEVFYRAGFRPEPYRYRWMQRAAADLPSSVGSMGEVRSPEAYHEGQELRLRLEREIALFLFKHASEETGPDQEERTYAAALRRLRQLAVRSSEDGLRASSLLYDRETRALIGICLIGMETGCPTIEALAVMPAYRGRGLASGMLARALSVLRVQGQPLLRIRVMHGHPLESLCYRLGFMPGPLFLPSMVMY